MSPGPSRRLHDARAELHDPNEIYLPMSRGEIGDYLGLTTETVSRTVGRLKVQGVIELRDFRHVIILDSDGLIDLAETERR